MNAPAKADPFGFAEVANRIAHSDLDKHVWQITDGCRRAGALLTLLRERLNGNDLNNVSIHDVEAIVGTALDALPRWDGQAFDALDDTATDIRITVRALQQRHDAAAGLLDAMEVAAGTGHTLDELTEAATAAYAIVTTLPDGPRHWDAFCELIVNRGLSVELVGMGAGLGPQPQVNSPETARQAEVTRRKMAAFIAASNEESAVRQKQPAAIRSNPTQKRD